MADNLDIFMHAERIQESGDDYTAANASGHFGAYQFDISTWIYALKLAGLQYLIFAGTLPSIAPPSVQDAAARALMSQYYGEFGNSFFNVAEAWYGGPGAVGHPNEGGGPGYPTVGQYASQVMAIYAQLGGTGGGTPTTPVQSGGYVAATLLELLLALNQEATQRGIGDAHSREQALAEVAAEAVGRAAGDDHSRQQAAAAFAVEAAARTAGDDHSRQQAAALVAAEALARAIGDADTRQQVAAAFAVEVAARTEGDLHSREQAAALVAAEAAQRAIGDADTRQQVAAALNTLDARLSADIATVLRYAQSLPALVDTRAANGYDPTRRDRATGLARLLDTVAAHQPEVAGLVSKLTTWIVDLAEIDDPVIRIAAQLVLKQVLDRLGLDSALHAMLGDLLSSVFGSGPPRTLQEVTADIGNRLDGLESSVAALSPLADEADKLHELGTLVFDAALVGFLVAAVTEPAPTAAGTVVALDAVTGPLLAPVRTLLGIG